jgi:hypothetical protein
MVIGVRRKERENEKSLGHKKGPNTQVPWGEIYFIFALLSMNVNTFLFIDIHTTTHPNEPTNTTAKHSIITMRTEMKK